MSTKFNDKLKAEIIYLSTADLTFKEIAEQKDISSSYVGKLVKDYKENPEKYKHLEELIKESAPQPKVINKVSKPKTKKNGSTKPFTVEDTISDKTEIEVLEMRINSMELNLKWMKELLEYKTGKKK